MAIQLSRRACITNSQWYSEQAQSVILKGLGSRCNIIDQKYQLAWIRTQRPAQTKTACRFEKSFLVFAKLYLKTSHTTTVYSKRNSSQCSSHCSTVIFFFRKVLTKNQAIFAKGRLKPSQINCFATATE